jgi:hypothetical protein
MPYQKTDAKLQQLITQAINDPKEPNIPAEMKTAKLTNEDVLAQINKSGERAWEIVAQAIREYDDQEKAVREAESKWLKTLPPEPKEVPPPVKPPDVLSAIAILISMVSIIAFVICGFIYGWRKSGNWLIATMPGSLILTGVVVSVVALVVSELMLYQERSEASSKYEEAKAKWQAQVQTSAGSDEIARLRLDLGKNRQTIDETMLDKVIKSTLRIMINGRLKPSYETRLNIFKAPGLAEVFDPSYAIDTGAKKSLRFLLDNMPGGSIGIAGPRGAGKSTLLRLFCGPKKIISELKGRPVLSVLVSAPVEYLSRDFILYLFSTVCQSLLEIEKRQYTRPTLPELDLTGNESILTPFTPLLRRLPRAALYLGILLVSLSVSLAWLSVRYAKPEDGSARQKQQPAAGAPAAENPQPNVTTSETSAPVAVEPPILKLVKALEIKPGTILMWGVFIIAVGLLLAVILKISIFHLLLSTFLGRRSADFLTFKFFRWKKVIDGGLIRYELDTDMLGTDELEAELQYRAERRRVEALRNTLRREVRVKSLPEQAEDWLRAIKFQQSYTSGWSGALKLPVGLEGGINRAVTLAEKQLSLPEIVHYFIRFLEAISQQYQVIIGIDELDKLESDEKAQRFLNEIKSIFGLERCFYLISVSENAMSNFERRGLPFRDVFDSSFDSIIYADYLNFSAAKNLIEQRVLGRPIPFFGLSYCLSGGLARDLIRSFRSLMELRGEDADDDKNDLGTLCKALIEADLKAKLRAVSIGVKKINLDPECDRFLEKLYRLESEFLSEEVMLRAAHEDWLAARPSNDAPQTTGEEDKKVVAARAKLRDFSEELSTYIYYLATLLQFFRNSLSEDELQQAETDGGGLDKLAKARQVMSINPVITRTMLDQFRLQHRLNWLPPMPFPAQS